MPGDQCLSREAIDAELVRQLQEEEYADKAVAIVSTGSFNLETIIQDVALDLGLSPEAKRLGLTYLEEAEKELSRLGMI